MSELGLLLFSSLNFLRSFHEVRFAHDVVAVKYGPRLMAANRHCNPLGNTPSNHVPYRAAAKVVEQKGREPGSGNQLVPALPEVKNRLVVLPSKNIILGILATEASRQQGVHIASHRNYPAVIVLRLARV